MVHCAWRQISQHSFYHADLKKAAKGVLFGIFLNSGRLCESGGRLLVQEDIQDQLVGKLK
ncbi:MAG: aldehyde dehydrogenase family protein [Nitrososphaerota archaeon]|nr:aldehyde dehydrogenase family protein [Nitrososphaerota archaeon]MDG6922939.1 aldehyde dehydrogenase family protein [Nitrososphaerota archaeon]